MKTVFTKTHTALGSFPSMAACAAATGIPLQIMRQAKRAGCPAFDQAGRVHLRPLLGWIFTRDTDGSTDWHARWKRAQALGAEQELAKERGELIDAAVLAAKLVEAGSRCKALVFQKLDSAAMLLAAAGDDVAANRSVLSDLMWGHHAAFRDTVSPFLLAIEEHTDAAMKEILNPPATDEKTEPKTDEAHE